MFKKKSKEPEGFSIVKVDFLQTCKTLDQLTLELEDLNNRIDIQAKIQKQLKTDLKNCDFLKGKELRTLKRKGGQTIKRMTDKARILRSRIYALTERKKYYLKTKKRMEEIERSPNFLVNMEEEEERLTKEDQERRERIKNWILSKEPEKELNIDDKVKELIKKGYENINWD